MADDEDDLNYQNLPVIYRQQGTFPPAAAIRVTPQDRTAEAMGLSIHNAPPGSTLRGHELTFFSRSVSPGESNGDAWVRRSMGNASDVAAADVCCEL